MSKKRFVSKAKSKSEKFVEKMANNRNKIYVVTLAIVVILIIVVIAGLVLTDNLKPIIQLLFNPLDVDYYGEGNSPLISDGSLTVHFVDVGQGDCIILQLPDNKTMIIDGGDKAQRIAQKVTSYIDALQINTFDYVLLTHTDADHCGSLDDALNAVDNVERVFLPQIRTKDTNQNLQLGLTENIAQITTIAYSDFVAAVLSSTYSAKGEIKSTEFEFLIDEIIIDSGMYRLSIYCVSEDYYKNLNASNSAAINDVSPICVLEYANRKIVFTGDANNSKIKTSAEKRFTDTLIAKGYSSCKSDVLKVAHHGGKDSSGLDFLEFVSVKYAVVCVGEKNGSNSTGEYEGFVNKSYYQSGYTFTTKGNGAYDHPHRAVAGIPINGEGRLAQSGVEELYRTDTHGDIVLIITEDGELSFSTQNKAEVNNSVVAFVNIKIIAADKEINIEIYYEERLRMF